MEKRSTDTCERTVLKDIQEARYYSWEQDGTTEGSSGVHEDALVLVYYKPEPGLDPDDTKNYKRVVFTFLDPIDGTAKALMDCIDPVLREINKKTGAKNVSWSGDTENKMSGHLTGLKALMVNFQMWTKYVPDPNHLQRVQ